MRIVPFLCSTAITVALVAVFDRPLGKVPPLGAFLVHNMDFGKMPNLPAKIMGVLSL